VIEGMYAKVRRGDAEQTFSFWGYGETNKLNPGSGLYVGQTGVAANHHFVLSVHHPDYAFDAGNYTIQVFARLVGESVPIRLSEIGITLGKEHAAALANKAGVLFELDPDRQIYVGHVNDRM
jgi:hypothetical protein